MGHSKFLKLALMTSATALCGMTTIAYAQSSDDGVSEYDEVVSVGTRGKPRSVLDSDVPIDVINANAIESAAALGGEVGEILQTLSPAFNFPRQSNSGSADTVRAGQLRGLNPDQVLVLINGKRQHTTSVLSLEGTIGLGNAPFDFNTVGAGSIKRIEVLRDGASAQYGSDAIAGVINIELKDGGDGGSAFASYGVHKTTFEPQNDRKITDGETLYIGGEYGFNLGDRGFIRVGAEYRDRNATARGGQGVLPFFELQTPANLATSGTVTFKPGDGNSQDLWMHYNAELEFENGMTGYSFGRYNNRSAEGTGFFRFPDSFGNVTSVYPNGFLPVRPSEGQDISLTFGVNGTAANWDWDLSGTYGKNAFDQSVENSINASLGAASPTSFFLGGFDRDQLTINGDLVRDISFEGMANPVTFAVGAEFRTEGFSTTAGDPASYADGGLGGATGAQTGPGLRPDSTADLSRDVFGFYADVSAPLTDRLTLGLAGRFENYSDFGSTITGKASGRFEFNDYVALRAAVSNSFRAPSIVQIGYENTTTNFGVGGQLVQVGQVSVNNPLALANGAQPLEEEKAINLSGGIIFTPLSNLSLTVDAYQVDIDDRLSLQRVQAANITFFTNLVDTRTKGVDIVGTYSTELFGGDLNLSAAMTFTDTKVKNPSVIGEEELNILETAAPDSKIILSSDWSKNKFDVNLRLTQFGETTRDFDFGGGFPDPQTYAAKWSFDTEIGYDVTDKWKVAVGADNLFDEYPDLSDGNINYFGNLPYDVLSGIGSNGRYLYVRTKVNF